MPRFSTIEVIRTRAFRRALSFLIGIGCSALAGLWFEQAGGLLLGVITALMFSFADDEGPLARRFIALGRAAAGLAIGGALGRALGGYGPLFWILFVAAAFAAAWLNRSGKTVHIGARLAVMAMAITAGSPELSRIDVLFVVGALIVVSLARLADHAVFGPLPASTLPARPSTPESNSLWLRFAAAYAVAATIGLWVGVIFDPRHAIWVTITTLVVMQPDERGTYRRIVERVLGTAAGVAVAFVLTQFIVFSPAVMVAALLVTSAMLPHHIPVRYWLHTAAIALLVLLTYDLASRISDFAPMLGPELFTERLIDVVVGCVLALAGTAVAFPWAGFRQRT